MTTSLKICYPHTPAENIVKDPQVIARLRALRLWHWNQSVLCRSRAVLYRNQNLHAFGRFDDEEADLHIKYVQELNQFFEIGDYAEHDAENG